MQKKEKMPALSIRQPYCEQILRGVKTIEYRSKATKRIGRVYLYASLTPGPEEEWEWMGLEPGELPTGVIVGTIEVTGCTGEDGDYEWHLANPERASRLRKPKNQPMPSWFFPF
ncbi:MAG: ASCH domain-containing protein [Bacteroidetes bacterium]|nr:ASCH domain-containing protein [Bacteroidota bacterium]